MTEAKIIEGLLPLAVDIGEVKPLTNNPRRGRVEAVARSLEKFGQRRPIVVNSTNDEIEAGNHTYQAALQLGWDRIAVVFVEDSDEVARAYALADNRTHDLGEYDDAELDAWLSELAEVDESLVEAAGFDLEAVLAALPDDADDFVSFSASHVPPIEVEHDRSDAVVEIPQREVEVEVPDRSLRVEPKAEDDAPPPLEAYTRFAEKAREEVVDPQAVNDPDVWVIFKFGDLRAKVPRKAFEEQFDRIFREADRNLNEAGRQAVMALGFKAEDVVAARRGEREVKS